MIIVLVMMCLFGTATCGAKDCCPKLCDLSDVGCTTAGGSLIFKLVVGGENGLLQNMDPLTIKEVCSKNDATKYTLTNVELKGLAKCGVTKLQLNVTTGEDKLYLHCPELIATFNYRTSGTPTSQDKIVITANDYDILYVGFYGVFISPEDLNPHFFIKNISPKVSVKVTKIDVKGLGDDANSNSADITQQTAENVLSVIVMRTVKILLQGVDVVLRKNQMSAILPAIASTKPCN